MINKDKHNRLLYHIKKSNAELERLHSDLVESLINDHPNYNILILELYNRANFILDICDILRKEVKNND